MRTQLDQLTARHHTYPVRPFSGGEPVSNSDDAAALHQTLHCLFHQQLGAGIERGRGFVENQNRRISKRSARERHQLAFASRQRSAALEHFGPGPTSYSALKGGAIVYAAGLAQTLAPKGIRVNTISPGPIFFEAGPWDRLRGAAPEFFDATVASQPMGRMGTPEEVANVAAFLCSPAASWVTGDNVVVDGAYTKRIAY